jgi:hypothetical protein
MMVTGSKALVGRLAADAAGLLRLAWDNLRVRVRDWRTWEPPQYVDLRRVRRTWERRGDDAC